jgi:RNA polymerase sigma factor (sigma-70 family)
MNEHEQWLADCANTCVRAVTGALVRLGVSPQRAADLAGEGVSFAHAQAIEQTPAFTNLEHARKWVVRVAINRAIQLLRTDQRRRKIEARIHTEGRANDAGSTPRPSPMAPFLEMIPEYLAMLPAEQRLLVRLSFLEGYTLEEIAGVFGSSTATIFRRRREILARLRELMTSRGDVPPGWQSPPGPASP